MDLFRFRFEGVMTPTTPITADGVTDIIELLVDELDVLGHVASVSTAKAGRKINIEVEFDDEIDPAEVMDWLARCATDLKSAFHGAGVGTAKMLIPIATRSQSAAPVPAFA